MSATSNTHVLLRKYFPHGIPIFNVNEYTFNPSTAHLVIHTRKMGYNVPPVNITMTYIGRDKYVDRLRYTATRDYANDVKDEFDVTIWLRTPDDIVRGSTDIATVTVGMKLHGRKCIKYTYKVHSRRGPPTLSCFGWCAVPDPSPRYFLVDFRRHVSAMCEEVPYPVTGLSVAAS